jgi:hypothetical protein
MKKCPRGVGDGITLVDIVARRAGVKKEKRWNCKLIVERLFSVIQ